MFFLLVSIIVPIMIYVFSPKAIQIVTGKSVKRDGVLLLACLIYFLSWYLPSPLIEGRNTAFTTHFVGGGLFTGLLWLFVKQQMQWKTSWFIELLSVYAAVSALGVANELFEFIAAKLHLVRITGADTWWDLCANTLGALTFWIFYRIALYVRRETKK
jgi:hypothetical protein